MAGADGRKQWTVSEAQALLEAWERSGLPLATFAKQRGYVPERLRRWQKKLRRGSAPAPRFVRVELGEPERTESATPRTRCIEIVLPSGLRVLAADPTDAQAVARLVAALRAQAC